MSTRKKGNVTPSPKKSKAEDQDEQLSKNMSRLSLESAPEIFLSKKNLVVVTTPMATSNGCLILNVKTMNALRIRTGDPVRISPVKGASEQST
jgi:hypothetical protein